MDAGVDTTWAVIIIVVVPVLIIGATELEERLRQRDSELRSASRVVRVWALPFFALWAVLVPVLGLDGGGVGPRLVASGLVLSLGVAVLRILGVIVDELRDRPRGIDRRPVPQLLLALPRLGVIIAIAWILVSTVWGVDLSAALTALGVTSLVVSFALQDTLSGLASGVLLLSDPPFHPGDWIEAGDVEGVVVDVGWRTTQIRDRNGDVITVPNSQLASANIVNYSSPEPLHRVVVSLQVAYVNPPTLAKEMLLDAARATPGVLDDPPPFVTVVQIDDPLMGYEVHMWIDDYAIAPRVKGDFGALVWYQSHRHGVPLPSPAQDLYLYDGDAEAAKGQPTLADIRDKLAAVNVWESLPDHELDQLAQASTPARFAVGELILDARVPTRDFVVIVEGRAQMVFIDHAEGDRVVAELVGGDVIDLVSTMPTDGRKIALRAITDCDVLVVQADAAAAMGSRNPDIAAAFTRVSSVRRRRIERMSTPERAAGEGGDVAR